MKKLDRILLLCISILALYIITFRVFAHEQWLLTPNEMEKLQNQTSFSFFEELFFLPHLFLSILAVAFTVVWICLAQTRIKDWFYLLQKNLNSYAKAVPFILRVTTGIMLLICFFNLIPQKGIEPFTTSTLFASDLNLDLLTPSWQILKWMELAIAIFLLLGIYVRLTAFALLILIGLSLVLFQSAMMAYLGFYLGISLFLLLKGGGIYFFNLFVPKVAHNLIRNLNSISYEFAEYILQILTGLNFIYVGIIYKFLQPNLDLLILMRNNVHLFGISYISFVLLMALVEILSGVIIISGAFIRLLSLIFFGLFAYLSWLLNENFFAHTFIFGILLSFIIIGPGSIRLKEKSRMHGFSK